MSTRIALVVAETRADDLWGEDRFIQGVSSAMEERGFDVEIISVVHDESSYEAVSDTYARYAALDMSGFGGVICSNIPSCLVPHPNKVCYLLRTARQFYDAFEIGQDDPASELRRLRRHIQELDRDALNKARSVFVAGYEIRMRLLKYLGTDSEVLYPCTTLGGLKSASYEFLLLPGRLHPMKRQDLVVAAMEQVKNPVELLICGAGESEASLRSMASKMTNIHFLGRVDDERLADLYSRAIAVPYVPIGEDFGFVALETALSGKPIITCTDSGEPARMVFDARSGFIVPPDPKEIARCIDIFVANPGIAAEMGRVGRGTAGHASREHVGAVLHSSLMPGGDDLPIASPLEKSDRTPSPRPLVLDSQPLSPATNGSRVRALGMYGKTDFNVRFLGALDGGGEERRFSPTTTLEELNIPLSEQHLSEIESLKNQPGGPLAIDVSFSLMGALTPAYAAAAESLVSQSDALVFSRPWSYPLVEKKLGEERRLLVYDAHHVEGVHRCARLDDGASGTELVTLVGELEADLCTKADLILTPSHSDRASFARLYNVPYEKIRVVPNGAFTDSVTPAGAGRKAELKEAEGLGDVERKTPLAVFMGAASPSNIEAAEFILGEVAPVLPDVQFLIFGEVGDALSCPVPRNARVLGVVDEQRKNELLSMADVALNPIYTDGATNLKMLDYMAAGLPIISSAAPARGIDFEGVDVVTFSNRESFAEDLRILLEEPAELERSGAAGRSLVEERHSWEAISKNVGALLRWHSWYRNKKKPFFSVIICGYERPKSLWRLARLLKIQTFSDFEMIVIDQSQTPWTGANAFKGLDILYMRTGVMSATRAKNTGAFLSRGTVLAFLDDDCEPSPNWLACARPWFDDEGVSGLEGAIRSDPGWNNGREKAGDERSGNAPQKTSNFFARTEVFNRCGGFNDIDYEDDPKNDVQAGDFGQVPFSRDAWVFMPCR